MTCQICIHTNDKHYTQREVERESSTYSLTKPNPNALNRQVWAEETIYWKRESSYEWIDDKTMDKMISAAFLESSMHTPLKIRKRNRNTSDAHIKINWWGKKDEPYFTSQSTLAYGYGPGSGLGGDVTMNSDVLWLLRDTPLTAKEAKEKGYIENYSRPDNIIKHYDPLHTMKHEGGGHALGMNHITNLNESKTAIMFPYYNGLREFGDADINYIKQLYGDAGISKIISDTIRKRINNF